MGSSEPSRSFDGIGRLASKSRPRLSVERRGLAQFRRGMPGIVVIR